MTKVALKSLRGHPLRTFLTALAVVLGVAMVAGSYILTDTLLNAADELETTSYDRVDAVVTARTAFDPNSNDIDTELQPIPERLVQRVKSVPEVATASGEITDTAQLIGRDGKVIGGEGGPTFASGFDTSDPRVTALSPYDIKQGRFPQGPGQIAIDATTAKDKGYKVGDTIGVTARGPLKRFRIAGIVTFGKVESIGNATLAVFTLRDAQALFKRPGLVDTILLRARAGVTTNELESAVGKVLPASVEVKSAKAQDRYDIGGLKDFLGILQKILLGLGLVAVFVGAFIIFNTLSITVAQRTREFALLRTLGASRRQVLRSVVLEAVVIGLIASVVGILVGIGLAKGLNALFSAIGGELPSTSTVFNSRTVIVALVVGVGVTVLAGLSPAMQATRVAPVEALREGAVPKRTRSRAAPYVAAATTAIGVLALAYGMFAPDIPIGGRLASIGLGVLVLFIGVALISRRIVRPLASALGRPAQRIGGAAGRLARENSMRDPGRTATTAAALMIGLALVTFVAVLGQGLRSSYGSSLDDQLDASYVLVSEDGFTPFAPEAAQAAARAPGVTVTSDVREDQIKAFGKTMTIDGINARTWGRLYKYKFTHGSDAALRDKGRNAAVITKRFADDHDLSVLSSFRALTPNGKRLNLAVVGIDDRPEFNPLGLANVTIAQTLYNEHFATKRPRYAFIDTARGGDAETAALKKALAGFPGTKLQTQEQFKKDSEQDINDLLGILYVMLMLSVIVSLFGIVNTLVLSVFERTRELGMLRAIGMTRRQVRRMIRHESIIVALIGAVLGMAVGFFLAALVVGALSSEGIVFAVPIGTLIAFLIVAILAGMLAAILPARRAARLNVLEALQYE